MIGERIRRARKAAGLSLRALAQSVGLSHTTLNQFEHDTRTPDSGQLVTLASALGVRTEYFLRPTRVTLGTPAYRAHSRLSAKLRDRIHADVLDQLERWQELVDRFPMEILPSFIAPVDLPNSIPDEEAIEDFADALRTAWHLGENPIPELIDVLEYQGILVVQTKVDAQGQFNGLSATAANGNIHRPIIVVHAQWPGDRQRFTLAHELGHLILEPRLAAGLDVERACNWFAGALLLPRRAVREALGETRQCLEPRELALLKSEFGLSMQACLFRALQAGVIREPVHRKLFRQFAQMGWRTKEPGPELPPERTFRFSQIVYRALAEDFISESRAAELLGLTVRELHKERRMEGTDASADQ